MSDSYDDMIFRLSQLADDIILEQQNEVEILKGALNRAKVDKKRVDSVFFALRI